MIPLGWHPAFPPVFGIDNRIWYSNFKYDTILTDLNGVRQRYAMPLQ